MNDYTIEDGLFIQKFDAIVSEKKDDLILPYFPVSPGMHVTVTENDEGEEGKAKASQNQKKAEQERK